VGVAPLVVVPAQHLDAIADHLGQRRVYDRAALVALEVRADQQVRVDAQDALQFPLGGSNKGGVQVCDGRGLLSDVGQIHDRHVGSWNADGEAVELAGGLGDHQLQRLGGAGGAGNHVQRGGAGAAQVLVRKVQNDLVVGVAMNGGHDAGDEARGFQNHLDDRRQAVCGATGVRDDVVLGRIVLVLVHAQHDGDVFVGGRSRDDDLLHGRAQVCLGFGRVGKVAGRLDDHLCAYIGPGQLGGVALGPHLDLLAVDRDKVLARLDLIGQIAQDRVVLEQVSQRRRAGQIVDGDKLDIFVAKRGAQNVAANAAEAVNSNLYCHV